MSKIKVLFICHGDISINHADDYVERVKRLVR